MDLKSSSRVNGKNFVARITVLLSGIFVLLISGCSNLSTLLFYPDKHYVFTPNDFGLEVEHVELQTPSGDVLANWLLKSKTTPKGTILFLHGNGENISTHINSVAWLPQQGYEVLLLDYRGYGKSTGTSTLASAFEDIDLAHRWLSHRTSDLPLVLFGQSLGGALAITYTANYDQNLKHISALIAESAPANWPQVARETMRKGIITWLLQIPASFIPYKYNAEDHIANIKDTPILLMHSQDDPIVAYHHSQQLIESSENSAQFFETQGRHIAGLQSARARNAFLTFLDAIATKD